jgi:hypothetical protein
MPRVYQRRFDWDEAKRLYADRVPIAHIAARLGVSDAAIRRIVIPGKKEIMDAHAAAFAAQPVPCIEGCGRTATRITARYGNGRCRECASITLATSVRPDALQCVRCKEWKADDGFPHNRKEQGARRGRHTVCRPCSTSMRREYRERHKVPCTGCGKLALPANEKGARRGKVPRCLDCMIAYMRTPEGREASRRAEAAGRRRRAVAKA